MAHTPGSWGICGFKEEPGLYISADGGKTPICLLFYTQDDAAIADLPNVDENARLICAAPILLEIAQYLVEKNEIKDREISDALKKMIEPLSTATGGSQQ